MSSTMTEEILAQVPISQLAARLGTDEATARRAAEAALPALLAGMTAQTADPRRAQGLAQALEKDHDGGLLEADDPVSRVDIEDGSKIVGHVFGDRRPQVESQLQGFLGGDGGIPISKLLPLLAPLVMSYFKKKMTGSGEAAPTGGGGLGDVLGGILGGGGGRDSGGGGIGDILGSVLGGGERPREDAGGGGIGDILGSVLGGDGDRSGHEGGWFDDVMDGIRDKDKKSSPLDDLLGSILGR